MTHSGVWRFTRYTREPAARGFGDWRGEILVAAALLIEERSLDTIDDGDGHTGGPGGGGVCIG